MIKAVGLLEDQGASVLLRWSVEDSGVGIDSATMERLFQPFSQGDTSIARRYGGTGLGLNISWNLVDLMGGCLELLSLPGQGSRFAFELWVERGPERLATADQHPARAVRFEDARILVAEDQPINQRVIGDMLGILGASHILAANGEEALARLDEAEFDAVLMDIQMPGMDGLTATAAIRANPDWAGLPVIALTAGVTEAERSSIVAAGLNDLLAKPLTLEGLTLMLARWIPGKARFEQARDTPGVPAAADAALELPGFDLSQLGRIARSEERIRDLLRQFADSVRDDVDTMAAALEAGDRDAAAEAVHRLKGVASNVGARSLQSAAEQLERLLCRDADAIGASGAIEVSLARLRHCHAQALERIDRLSPSTRAAPAASAGDPEAAARLLGEVGGLVTERQFVSRPLLDALRDALPASAHSDHAALLACLDQIDYPGAESCLAALGEVDPPAGRSHD